MAGTREIRTKIKSVQNTQKITQAIEMVSASKIRKAQERMKRLASVRARDAPGDRPPRAGEPRVPASVPGRRARRQARRLHRRLDRPRPVRRPERQPVPQACSARSASGRSKGVEVDVVAIGSKAHRVLPPPQGQHARQRRRTSATGRTIEHLIGVIKVMLDAYSAGKIDRLFLVQRLRQHDDAEADGRPAAAGAAVGRRDRRSTTGTTSTSPIARDLLEHVLTRYIESQVYQAALENVACEMPRAWSR